MDAIKYSDKSKEELINELIVLNKENSSLRESSEKYRLIFDNSPMGLLSFDAKGTINACNDIFVRIIGSSRQALIGLNMLDLPDLKLVSAVIQALNGSLGSYEGLYKSYTARKTSQVRVLFAPMVSGEGTICGGVGIIEDISQRKHAEEELVRAKERAEESDRLKSAFLANMSHEIRTPMNGILGFAGLLKEPTLTGEEQKEYIAIIERSGNRMLNIINDIVDISKIESGLMEVRLADTNINEQIDCIYTFFKPEVEGKGMKLSFIKDLNSKESIIKTDKEKIDAILINLIKNSIKYSKEGFIEFGYYTEQMDLTFFVKDTGIGIPLDRQQAIFDRFVQADIADKGALHGSGLGLAISKAYVEMLGGKIWVESKPGEGSCFYFTIPYKVDNDILKQNFKDLRYEQQRQ